MAKLSKREQAAKVKGGTLNYRTGKITATPQLAVKKRPAPLYGAGPLLPGQSRVANSYTGGLSNQMDTEGYTNQIFNALPSSSPAKVSLAQHPGGFAEEARKATASKQREQAAKAQQRQSALKSSSGGSSLLGIPTAQASTTDYSKASLVPTTQESGFGKFLRGAKNVAKGLPIVGPTLSLAPDLGISEALGLNKYMTQDSGLAEYRTADNQYIADQQGMADYGQLKEQDPSAAGDVNDYMQSRKNQQAQRDSGNLAPWLSSVVPTAHSSTGDTGNSGKGNNFDPSFMGNGEGDANDTFYQNPANFTSNNAWDYSQQKNDQYNGGPGPVDQAPPQVTHQVRGSGLFGTGKGVGNPAGDDPYIKELRKAYASNGGEKWLRKQFEELIAALDPTYAQMQKEGTDALNAQLNNQNLQLASVMNANNVGDSEQRAQLMAGQQRDTTTALGNLLAKLAQNKAGDVSGYKSEQAKQMGQLQERNQTNRQRLLQAIQDYREKQLGRGGSGGVGTPKAPKPPKAPNHNEIFNWTQDALNKGYSWQEIADNAAQQGIGTETGSYLDQLLNNANKQRRFVR